MNRDVYVYQVPIIDYWEPMVPFECVYESASYQDCLELRELLEKYLYQLSNFFVTNWEGDIRIDELYIGEIPDPTIAGGVHKYIGFKQDNNGDTYLIFPFAMPVYAEFECTYNEDNCKSLRYQEECLDIVNSYAPVMSEIYFIKKRIGVIKSLHYRIGKELSMISDICIQKE